MVIFFTFFATLQLNSTKLFCQILLFILNEIYKFQADQYTTFKQTSIICGMFHLR